MIGQRATEGVNRIHGEKRYLKVGEERPMDVESLPACERPMFQKLNLRTKIVAITVPPILVLGLIAIYGIFLSTRGSGADLAADIRTLGAVALAAVLMTTLVGIVIGQSIQSPIEEATAAARELADDRLPAMLEALRDPNVEQTSLKPIVTDSAGELGLLIEALNDVQSAASNVTLEQQNMVRQSLAELVVNMARRNQTLLDRQIEYIDRLEAAEEDPDRLEELFGLDHLATRMRRNAESLLVLAGAEGARRRGGPVAIGDVLRVAMSEIEDYRHVQMAGIEDASIGAQGAVDLAHLLSELMENATQFSPPDTPVEVCGTRHPDGTYFITVTDHGIGMSPEQLGASNTILAAPPELGLSLSRSLGFIVIGRLAKRLEIEVELAHTPNGGVTAIVAVPASVLSSDGSPLTKAPSEPVDEAPAPTPAPAAPVAAPNPGELPPAPSAPAINFDAPAFAEPSPAEDTWTPPAMPERGAGGLGAPAPAEPAPAQAPAATSNEPAPQSDALAKLLGLDPSTAAPAEAAPPAATPAATAPSEPKPFDPADLFSRPASTPAPEPTTPWDAPVFDPNAAQEIAPASADQPPTKLEEAIPSAESFDQDVSSLLDNPGRTSSGLVKRDRSVSQAPKSEGRPIKASTRSPDEIRSMLARYRDGLKGRPLEGLAGHEAGGANPIAQPGGDMPVVSAPDSPAGLASGESFNSDPSNPINSFDGTQPSDGNDPWGDPA